MAAPDRWPRYREAVFTGWHGIPSAVRAAIEAAKLPHDFFSRRYLTLPMVEPTDVPGGGTLYRIGTEGLVCSIYWDPASGAVLSRTDRPIGPHQQTPAGRVFFVNSSLRQFVETVQGMLAAFPYYDRTAEFEELEAAADRLRALIEPIDPAALEPNTLWDAFAADVANGDFATEDVLALLD